MRRATPSLIDFGRRLLEHEAEGRESPPDLAEAAERVFRKMRGGLTEMIGGEGYSVLVARAIYLARADYPILGAARVGQPEPGLAQIGCLEGLQRCLDGQDARVASDALSTLIGSFIWLLATFIGEDMALRQLRRIWPADLFGEAAPGSQETVQ